MRTKQESPLSEEEEALVMEGLLSRKIWRYHKKKDFGTGYQFPL